MGIPLASLHLESSCHPSKHTFKIIKLEVSKLGIELNGFLEPVKNLATLGSLVMSTIVPNPTQLGIELLTFTHIFLKEPYPRLILKTSSLNVIFQVEKKYVSFFSVVISTRTSGY